MPIQTVSQAFSNEGIGGFTFRNRIINGAMEIDQRNSGSSVAIASGGFPFTLDRFRSDNSTDGAITVQRVTDAPTGFVNSMKYTVTTADASLASTQYLGLNHFIEGFNTADLMWGTALAKTITISFWVKSSITGNYPVSFDNNAADRFYIGQYSINSANTWEYKTVTIAGDTSGTWLTDNERGVNVRWFLGSGTGWEASANSWQSGAKYTFSGAASVIGTLNATWQITGVQFEVGSAATSFERRPYGMELALCQRYFFNVGGQVYSSPSIGGTAYSTNWCFGLIKSPVTMRAMPTFTKTGNWNWNDYNAVNISTGALTFTSTSSTLDAFWVASHGTSSGLTQLQAYFLTAGNDATARLSFSAEL